MSLYLRHELSADPSAYEPLTSSNVAEIENQVPGAMGNLHWLLLALACVVEGEKRGFWTIEVPTGQNGADGHLVLRKDADAVSMFFLDRTMHRSRLEKLTLDTGSPSHPVVLLYPADPLPAASVRYPARTLPGSAGIPDELVELSLQELLEGTTTEDALMDAFHKEFITARTAW
jgi:hypothetical protein